MMAQGGYVVSENPILWEASDAQKRASAIWRFAEATQHLHGGSPDDYWALHRWSINEPDAFHLALWDFLEIVGERGERGFVAGDTIRGWQFYPDARLNYAENLLQRRDDGLAIIAYRDDGTRREITWAQLYDRVSQMVQALRAEGVGKATGSGPSLLTISKRSSDIWQLRQSERSGRPARPISGPQGPATGCAR